LTPTFISSTASRALRPRSGAAAACEAALEREVQPRVGEADRVVDPIDGGRKPGDGNIDVLEVAGTHHDCLGRAGFLGRAAMVAHPPPDASRREIVLDCGCCEQRGRAQHVVAAAVITAAFKPLP
jgi:hypothetical protein